MDSIIENDKKQDRVLTASINESVFLRIRKELPVAKEIVICTDNAKNYNNNALPVILPEICDAHGLQLQVYLHPDACHGKSCVDAHFAVSYRHLKRYIQETHYDVLTPEDIADALTYDQGAKNSTVEFISINRKHVDLDKYELASECKLIGNFDTPCEIRYEALGGDK